MAPSFALSAPCCSHPPSSLARSPSARRIPHPPIQVKRSTRVAAVRSFQFRTCAIAVGDKIPDGEFSFLDEKRDMQSISVTELCAGKKVVLFAVPGAFTPTCSQKHVPGFIDNAEALKEKGIEDICCIAVNDAFVMKAWGEDIDPGEKVMMLADGSATYTKALGVDLDLMDKGLGIRSRRYSMLVDDCVVTMLNLEEGGAFTISGATEILESLSNGDSAVVTEP